MPRLPLNQVPAYRRHRPSGQAVVSLDGRDFYLGPHGTQVSKDEYDRLTGIWKANGRRMPVGGEAAPNLTVTEVMAPYWQHARAYYLKNGVPTSEVGNIRLALRPVKRLFGDIAAIDFGPVALKVVRTTLVEAGVTRKSINRHIDRVKRMFKWAVENELIPASVSQGLATVSGLRRGRTDAEESAPVRPVSDELVNAVRPHVCRQVWAMVELQRLTGMRSGEVSIMRPRDIDMTGSVWLYRPESHKTEHRGHERIVQLGPRAQRIVGEFLPGRATDAYLFSPAEADAERKADMRERRRTKVQPSQLSRRKPNPKRKPRERYDRDSYRRAINRALDLAFPPPANIEGEALKEWRKDHCWHPHQLRHTFATRVRKDYGIESARILCGHRSIAVTATYAEIDRTKVQGIMSKIG